MQRDLATPRRTPKRKARIAKRRTVPPVEPTPGVRRPPDGRTGDVRVGGGEPRLGAREEGHADDVGCGEEDEYPLGLEETGGAEEGGFDAEGVGASSDADG